MITRHQPINYFKDPREVPEYSVKAGYWVMSAFLLCFLLVLKPEIDIGLFKSLNAGLNTLLPNAWWAQITDFGNGALIGTLLVFFAYQNPVLSKRILLGIVFTGVCIAFFKKYYAFSRPANVLDVDSMIIIGEILRTRSFPSGHTATIFSAAALVWYSIDNTRLKTMLLAFAILVGLSRIAVGAHFPKDVALGAFLGWGMVFLATLRSRISFGETGHQRTLIALSLIGTVTLINQKNEFTPQMSIELIRGIGFLIGLFILIQTTQGYISQTFHLAKTTGQKARYMATNTQNPFLKKVAKFGMVGAAGFLVDILVYAFLQSIGFSLNIARFASFWVAASNNWFFNRVFTFSDAHKEPKRIQWPKYLTMTAISFGINVGSYYWLTHSYEFMAHYHYIPFLIGIALGTVFNFSVSNWIIFKEKEDTT